MGRQPLGLGADLQGGPALTDLDNPPPPRARATLNAIRAMWGTITVEGDTVTRRGMYGQLEVWRRVTPEGPKAIYEKQGGE
jgi:hypothetical protein